MDRSTAALGVFLAATLACEVAAAQSYDPMTEPALDSTSDRAQESAPHDGPRHAAALPSPLPGPRSMCSDPFAPPLSQRTGHDDGRPQVLDAAGDLVPAAGAPSVSAPRPTPAAARLEVEALADLPAQGAAPDESHDEVPWCVSGDDPRCAPIGGGSTPVQVDGRTPVSGLCTRLTEPAWPQGDIIFTARTGHRPRAGVSFRIERPPRRA
jgi:hypothetical protein